MIHQGLYDLRRWTCSDVQLHMVRPPRLRTPEKAAKPAQPRAMPVGPPLQAAETGVFWRQEIGLGPWLERPARPRSRSQKGWHSACGLCKPLQIYSQAFWARHRSLHARSPKSSVVLLVPGCKFPRRSGRWRSKKHSTPAKTTPTCAARLLATSTTASRSFSKINPQGLCKVARHANTGLTLGCWQLLDCLGKRDSLVCEMLHVGHEGDKFCLAGPGDVPSRSHAVKKSFFCPSTRPKPL